MAGRRRSLKMAAMWVSALGIWSSTICTRQGCHTTLGCKTLTPRKDSMSARPTSRRPQMSLPPFLNKLRQRPGMYIGEPSLTRLAAFLRGYDFACHELQATPADPFFLSFQAWVSNRLHAGSV